MDTMKLDEGHKEVLAMIGERGAPKHWFTSPDPDDYDFTAHYQDASIKFGHKDIRLSELVDDGLVAVTDDTNEVVATDQGLTIINRLSADRDNEIRGVVRDTLKTWQRLSASIRNLIENWQYLTDTHPEQVADQLMELNMAQTTALQEAEEWGRCLRRLEEIRYAKKKLWPRYHGSFHDQVMELSGVAIQPWLNDYIGSDNVFVSRTGNHVVAMVDRQRNQIARVLCPTPEREPWWKPK